MPKCRVLLRDIGQMAPRFVKLFGPSGTRTTPPSHVEVQDDSFRCGSSSPPTIAGYLKEVKNIQAWSTSFSYSLDELGEFDVASFLKDQCARGPSVPLGCYRALVWGEKVFDMICCTSAPMSFLSPTLQGEKLQRLP